MYLVYFIIVFLLSYFLTKFLIKFLSKKKILDLPSQRKNHNTPTPRGGGMATIISILVCILIYSLQYHLDYYLIYLIFAIFICASISLIDDVIGLSIPIRMLCQIISIYFVLEATPMYESNILLNFFPLIVEKILVALALILFINIYNFMDGIDGLATSQTIYIAISILIFSLINFQISSFITCLCIIIISANLGFLIFNRSPAKIFMGDVGSITLGLICSWLLLNLAIDGYVVAAIIIPGYYLMDGISTIIKRLLQNKKIWHAHSDHFYQIAVRSGQSHAQVTKKIMLCNIILLLLSLTSVYTPILSLILAALFISGFLYCLVKT